MGFFANFKAKRAAKHLNGNKPVDGWLVWKIKNTGQSLASLRQ
jgi:hypothetical protein